MNVEAIVTEFILKEIAYDLDPPVLPADAKLLDGIIDSTDVLRLVMFLEERFGVQVADDDLVPENFATVATLGEYVRRKLGPGA